MTLLRARAIENTVWVAAVGQVPDPDEKPTRAPTGRGPVHADRPARRGPRRPGPAGGRGRGRTPTCRWWTGPGHAAVAGQPPRGRLRREPVQAFRGRPGTARSDCAVAISSIVFTLTCGGMSRRPVDRLGDVVGGQRLHARVDGVRLLLVAAEPDQGELRVGHARLDAGDPDAGAVQVAAQVQAELVDERLRAAVHVPARVRVGARHRAEVDHVAAPAGDHAGQDRPGAVDQALAVGVDHLVPVVQVGVLGRAPGRAPGRRCSPARRRRRTPAAARPRGGTASRSLTSSASGRALGPSSSAQVIDAGPPGGRRR